MSSAPVIGGALGAVESFLAPEMPEPMTPPNVMSPFGSNKDASDETKRNMDDAADAERRKSARGRSSTLLTGGTGLLPDAGSISKKTLLGA
jgi:hypothetical protein